MNNEINVPDPWGVTVTENNIGEPLKLTCPNTFTIAGSQIEIPKTAGCWRINGNFHVHVAKRPNRLSRLMTRFLLGWEWMDT